MKSLFYDCKRLFLGYLGDLKFDKSKDLVTIMTNLVYSILFAEHAHYLKNASTSAENSGVLDAAL